MKRRHKTPGELSSQNPFSTLYGNTPFENNPIISSDPDVQAIYDGSIFKDERFKDAFEEVRKAFEIEEEEEKQDALIAEMEEEIKQIPQSPVEDEIQQLIGMGELDLDYQDYKSEKEEFEALYARTYGGRRNKIHERALKLKKDGGEMYEIDEENDNWIKTKGKQLHNFITDWVAGTTSFISALYEDGTDWGYEKLTPEEKERMDYLERKIHTIEKPVLEKQRAELQEEMNKVLEYLDIDPNSDEYFALGKDISFQNYLMRSEDVQKKRDILDSYKKAIQEYDNAIEGRGFGKGFIQDRIGLLNLGQNARRTQLANKIKNDEELTELEALEARAYFVADEAMYGGLNPRKGYELGKSVRHSAEFMGEMWGGIRIAKAVSKIVPAVGTGRMARFSSAAGREISSPFYMAISHNTAMERYFEQVQMIEDENGDYKFVATEAQKRGAAKDIEDTLKIVDYEISQLKEMEEDGELSEALQMELMDRLLEKEYLTSSLNELINPEDGSLQREEVSWWEAGTRGVTESMKERFAERAGGKIEAFAGRAVGKLGIGKSRFGRKMQDLYDSTSKFRKGADDFLFNSNQVGKLTKEISTHVGGTRMLQSLPTEMLEEVLIQFMPTFQGSYIDQMNELTDADFYTMVGASTLIMNGGFSSFGAAKHYTSLALDKKYRDNIKTYKNRLALAKDHYRRIDQAIDSEDLAKEISMGTSRSVYKIFEMQAKIAELRNKDIDTGDGLSMEDRLKKADQIERSLILNMAIEAIETGTVPHLKASLRRARRRENKKDSPLKYGYKLDEALRMVDKYEKIYRDSRGKLGGGDIFNKEIRKTILEETIDSFQKYKEENKEEFYKLVEEFNKKREEEGGYTISQMELENALENPSEDNNIWENEEFNNYVAEFIDEYAEEYSNLNKFLEYSKNISDLKADIKKLEKDLEYLRNPANKEEILKEMTEKIKRQLKNSANKNNEKEVKEELDEMEEGDPKTLAEINEKVIESEDKSEEELESGTQKNEKLNNKAPLDAEDKENFSSLADELSQEEEPAANELSQREPTAEETSQSETSPTSSGNAVQTPSDIETQKADIERRRQKSNENQLSEIGSNRFLKLNKEGENTELSEVELKLINSLIDRMISQGKSAKEINTELISRGFVQSSATTPAQIETYLQSRIDGKINAKVGESISQEINAKYDAEIAALESKTTTTKGKVDSKDGPSDISKRLNKELKENEERRKRAKKSFKKKSIRKRLAEKVKDIRDGEYEYTMETVDETGKVKTETTSVNREQKEEVFNYIDYYYNEQEKIIRAKFKAEQRERDLQNLQNLNPEPGISLDGDMIFLSDRDKEVSRLKNKDPDDPNELNYFETTLSFLLNDETDAVEENRRLLSGFSPEDYKLVLEAEKYFKETYVDTGKIKEIREEAKKIRKEHQEESSAIPEGRVDSSELFDDEEATPMDIDPSELDGDGLLHAPIDYNPNDPTHTNFIKTFVEGIKKYREKNSGVDFDGFITSLRSDYNSRNVEQKFNLLREAWNQATGQNISLLEGQKVYDAHFASTKGIAEIESALGGSVNTTSSVPNKVEIQESDKAGEADNKQYNPETQKEENISFASHTERLFRGIGLKLGRVLGLKYKETQDGKETVTNEIYEDAKPFLDWRNFPVGSKVTFVFDIDYLLNPESVMTVWDNLSGENKTPTDSKPTRRNVSVQERLVEIFKNTPELNTWDKIEAALVEYKNNPSSDNPLFKNEEFLKVVPIGTVNKGYTSNTKDDNTPADEVLPGGLNDYYWFNNSNVALKVDKDTKKPLLVERNLRIEENRRINLEARRAILKNGNLEVTISEKSDARNNTRILETEEEKQQGYTNTFHSVLSQFGNDLKEFSKNAAIAFLDSSYNFIGSEDNSGKQKTVKIGKDTITKDRIINYNNFIENLNKRNSNKTFKQGRTVLIRKAGINEKGETLYMVHDLVTNHKAKQQEFARTKEILDALFHKLAIKDNDSKAQKAHKRKLQKVFKSQFGYEFTTTIKQKMEEVYATPNIKNGQRTGGFRQDFRTRAFVPGLFDIVPDFSQFETAEEFLLALEEGKEIPKKPKKEVLLGNLHTNLVFTPIEKNGETIYSTDTQPRMTFDFEGTSTTPLQKEIDQERVNRLERKEASLREDIKNSNNNSERKLLEEELDVVLKELDKEKTKQGYQEDAGTPVEVQDLDGNIISVDSSEIMRHQTETGEKMYIKDSEGNLMEVREVPETIEFQETDKNDIIEEIIARAFSDMDVSKNITIQELYNQIEQKFEEVVSELRNKGRNQEADHMEALKGEILGTEVYEDSVREYLSALLDISDIEEMLNLTGENVKDYNKSSFEVDVTKSLSFRVKLLFSGIRDPMMGEGFGGFQAIMSSSDALEALQQVLSEVKNNNLAEVEKVIQEKKNKNPEAFAFYDQILSRLKLVEKTNPDLLNEILYSLFQNKVQMRFVMWRRDANGYITLSNFDANVKNPMFVKRAAWTESLKRNGLLELYEGDNFRINPKAFAKVEELHKKIFEEYDKTKDINTVSRRHLEEYLKYFGITLNPKTIENIYNEQSQNDLELTKVLFDGKDSILNVLFQNLSEAANEERILTFDSTRRKSPEHRVFNILLNRNARIQDVIKADNFVEFIPAGSMYLAGKTVNMYQQHNAISNRLLAIKESLKDYIENLDNPDIPDEEKLTGVLAQLKNTPITSNSLLVGLLERNPEALVNYIDSFLMSLESLKEAGTKSRDDMNITELSDKDSLMTLLGMFVSSEGRFIDRHLESQSNSKLKLRKGAVNFPTLSDSSQMPLLKTILFDLTSENVDTENSTLDESILQVLREQMLEADLNRIADYLHKASAEGTNISGYDAGATWITGMPSLNTLLVDYKYTLDTGEVKTVKRPLKWVFTKYIQENPELRNNSKAIKDFIEEYKEEINEEITNNINHEVDKYISPDYSSGAFVEFEMVEGDKLKLSDGKTDGYFSNKNARLVAYDYVINNFIQQKEIQTLFAGDISFYFSSSMAGNLKHGLPKVGLQDVISFYYSSPEQLDRIREIMDGKSEENLSPEQRSELIDEFPELAFVDSMLSSAITADEAFERLQPVLNRKVNEMFKKVQNNLSKRLKGQISPGNQRKDSKLSPPYIQIMVSDVENASVTFEDLARNRYPEKFKDGKMISNIREFIRLNNSYNLTEESDIKRKEELEEILKEAFPAIAAYLRTASTDAQEYTSWKENLNQLRDQGRLLPSEYEIIYNKLEAQSKDLLEGDVIKPENRLTEAEMKLAVMQPSKPLYSGLVSQNINGHNVQRYVYIKSSSFPLLPELTQMFPGKLNNLRKNIEQLEDEKGTTVRVSYQSANKVGAVQSAVNISELYKENPDFNLIETSSVELPRENFYIQQDKPFKSDKNAEDGVEDRITRATQFEKIILGDRINKMGYIFPAESFDNSILEELKIKKEDGKISGKDLKKIYNHLYEKEQKILSEKLFNKLGIDSYADIKEGKPEVMENLARMLNRRLPNKQDRKALELLYEVEVEENGRTVTQVVSKREAMERNLVPKKAVFKFPLFMTPNSKKFESVFNSMINKNNINLGLPGFASPVASQEGFDYRGYSTDMLKTTGLILHPNFDPEVGLKSSRDSATGKLKYAQVFIANKFKVYNESLGQYEYINLEEYVDENGRIDLDKIPEELLSMFSFRIPTSSHQSGTIIEIAGFLPHTAGDLMIVPQDHTIQIGEDYDIDTRYVYQYNYLKTPDGKLKKMEYSDLDKGRELDEVRREYEIFKRQLWDEYYEERSLVDTNAPLEGTFGRVSPRSAFLEQNRNTIENLIRLEDALENYHVDNLVHAIFKEQYEVDNVTQEFLREKIAELKGSLYPRHLIEEQKNRAKEEYRQVKHFLQEAYRSERGKIWEEYKAAYVQRTNELKVIENNLISMYKSVFSSPDNEVQNLITKVLSTDFSGDSAAKIDEKLSAKEPYFNIYSPSTQRNVMKLGADGKMGIGVHSNAVTINSLLQQLDSPLQFVRYTDPETGEKLPYEITLGRNTFTGVLGRIDDGTRRISEYLMESQNSATDNQKLEIMGRRNENAETISVFSLLQLSGLEDDGLDVDGQVLSYASLFITQPAILEYVKAVKYNKSSTTKSFGNPSKIAMKELLEKYAEKVPESYWAIDKKTGKPIVGRLSNAAKEEIGKRLTSSYLFSQLRPEGDTTEVDNAAQFYILTTFFSLQKPAKELQKLQQFINIESGGLGISYFNTIDLKNTISSIVHLDVTTEDRIQSQTRGNNLFQEVFGEIKTITETETDTETELLNDGFIYISEKRIDGTTYKTFVKPSNHYSHKIMNSISLGYNLWNSIFPYDSATIETQINAALEISGINPDSKKAMELKYDIISNMKDYGYTKNEMLFGNNIAQAQRELFFDDSENNQQSLASYLVDLKNNPEYSYLFRMPFFKDLQFEINEKTYPSIIKYNTGDMSALNNLKIYNYLEKLVNSNRELPSKSNGKSMTEGELMKDLLKYALLADQGNGAIGFRQVLPLSLFEKYEVTENIREANNFTKESPSDFYQNFIRQYFQHNPTEVQPLVRYSETLRSSLNQILSSNGATYQQFNDGEVTEFSSSTVFQPYVVLETKTGEKMLFEKVRTIPYGLKKTNNVYKRIPTLGVFGFNEYNTSNSVNESKIEANNVSQWSGGSINIEGISRMDNEKNLEDVARNMLKNYNGPYNALLKAIEKFIPNLESIEVKVSPLASGKASYKIDTSNSKEPVGVVTISSTFLNNPNTTEKDVQDALIEELLHYVTTSTISEYITFTGIGEKGILYAIRRDAEGNPKTLPAPLQTLLSVYGKAVQHQIKKHGYEKMKAQIDAFKQSMKDGTPIVVQSGITEDSYRSMNIHEYIAGIFIKDSDFAHEMGQTPYLKSGKSILAKFSDALIKFFNRILPGAKTDSISANTLSTLIAFLEEHHDVPTNKLAKAKKTVLPNNTSTKSAQELIDEINQDIPGESTEKNISSEMYHGIPIIDTPDIINAEGQRGAAQYDGKNKVIKVNRPFLKQKFREKAWTKMRELTETVHGEESAPVHLKEYDSEVNKGVRGYSRTKVSAGGNGYYYVYAKKIKLEGFTDLSFIVYKNSITGNYTITESTTGYSIVRNEETIKSASDRALAILNEKGKEQVIKIIENTPKLGENIVKSKAKDLPENQFETYEQFEAFVIEHEYQHSVYPRERFDKENPGKTKGDYETAINERALFALEVQGILNNATGIDELFSPMSSAVSELFESNPELANQVYEAVGLETNITQDDKSYYRGQIEEPTIDKNGNLILYAKEDELYKRAGLKSKGVSMTDDLQSAIEYGNGQLEVAQNLLEEEYGYDVLGYEFEDKIAEIQDNGYYLIQIPKNISNEIVKEAGEVKVIGDKIVIPKGQYKIEQVIDGVNTQIAPQQKQPNITVQDLAGNTYSVNESDITTYETDFGPVRYITDENGDMVMLSNKNIGAVETQMTPQQAQQLYAQYLNTIFPDSKVKDIVYHGTGYFKGDKFTKDGYFTTLNTAEGYAKFNEDMIIEHAFGEGIPENEIKVDKKVIPAIVNIKNPKYLDRQNFREVEKNYPDNDGVISTNTVDPLGGTELQIKTSPEQIHILGSKQDIKGFKEFVNSNQTNVQNNVSLSEPITSVKLICK